MGIIIHLLYFDNGDTTYYSYMGRFFNDKKEIEKNEIIKIYTQDGD
jgi:hypothetical protein